MQDGSLNGGSVQPGTEAAHVHHASGESERVVADDHTVPERSSGATSVDNSLEQSDASQCPSWDEIDKKLHGGVEEYLHLFFGTTELAKDTDVIRPNCESWRKCIFDKTCATMSTVPIPQGCAADRQEAELDLIYSILYVVLMHLMTTHPEKKRRIRTVRFRINDVCVQRNKRLMVLRREKEKERE